MRNLILFIFSTLLFCSCGKSKEEKADSLIKKYLLEELYNYDSYSFIESKFDEAYNIALNDSVCRKHAANIVRIRNNYRDGMRVFTHQMEEAGLFTKGEDMQGYSIPKIKCYYPEIYETHVMIEKLDNILSDEILQLKNHKPFNEKEHIGYSVIHKFRYKDSFGNPATGNYYFLFDKKLKEIIYAANFEDEACKSMISVLNQFCSANE